jgi:hypothetical protein
LVVISFRTAPPRPIAAARGRVRGALLNLTTFRI